MISYMTITTTTRNINRCDDYHKSVTHVTITVIISYDTKEE